MNRIYYKYLIYRISTVIGTIITVHLETNPNRDFFFFFFV